MDEIKPIAPPAIMKDLPKKRHTPHPDKEDDHDDSEQPEEAEERVSEPSTPVYNPNDQTDDVGSTDVDGPIIDDYV